MSRNLCTNSEIEIFVLCCEEMGHEGRPMVRERTRRQIELSV